MPGRGTRDQTRLVLQARDRWKSRAGTRDSSAQASGFPGPGG